MICGVPKAAKVEREKLKENLRGIEEKTTSKMKELEAAHDAKTREYEAMEQRLKASERRNGDRDHKMEELKQEFAAMARDHAECVKSHVVCWQRLDIFFDLLTFHSFRDYEHCLLATTEPEGR